MTEESEGVYNSATVHTDSGEQDYEGLQKLKGEFYTEYGQKQATHVDYRAKG